MRQFLQFICAFKVVQETLRNTGNTDLCAHQCPGQHGSGLILTIAATSDAACNASRVMWRLALSGSSGWSGAGFRVETGSKASVPSANQFRDCCEMCASSLSP